MKPIKLGPTDEGKLIKVTIHLRRRPDHAPIPTYDDYVGCPYRPRLSIDEFARRYGAHPRDTKQVIEHCKLHGLTILSDHAARRHVCVEGYVRQFNAAFGVTVHDHQKGEFVYHKADRPHVVPSHLSDVIIHVGLGEDPKERATYTEIPPNTPMGATSSFVPPATYASLAGWPIDGTGQNIAVICFTGPNAAGANVVSYSLSDVQATCANWGIAAPTPINISIDGSPLDTTDATGEWNMDICCSWAFGLGAQIVVYFLNFVTSGLTGALEVYARIVHPDPGDPICSVTTESGAYLDEADAYVDAPTFANALHMIYEDAAIQSVTICLPTGDYGSGSGQGDGKDHCCGSVDPYTLAVGGTVFGTTPFVEWLANFGITGDSTYRVGGGGGVSIYVPLPSYQNNSNVPPSTNSGTIGRGIPDISSVFFGSFTIYVAGVQTPGGGTSQSCPMTAGLIASINAAIGRNVGFLNPTLYAQTTNVVRDINPSNTVGGPQTNSNGFWINSNNQEENTPVPGYPLETGWDPCVGLGVILGNNLVSYLQGNLPPALTYTKMLDIDNTICSYWGGNVMDACQITPVFWGTGWASATNPSTANIVTALNAIINAGYFDAMNEYFIFNRPTVATPLIDASSSAAASAGDITPITTNLTNNLTNATFPTPIVDNNLFLYLIGDGSAEVGQGMNSWMYYNNTIQSFAAVFPQGTGIQNWTPLIIREIVGAMTEGNGWPSAWNVFSSSPYVLAGVEYGTIGQTQIATWNGSNIGTIGGYAVPGYYSNVLRATIINGSSSSPVPAPPPSPPTPSPQGTTLTNTTGTIIDASGNTWQLVGSAGNYTIDENGSAAGFSSGVILLLYYGSVIYQENSSALWWLWNDGWVASSDPRPVSPPVPSPPPPAPPPSPPSSGLTQGQLNTIASAIEAAAEAAVPGGECWSGTCYPQNFDIGDVIITQAAGVQESGSQGSLTDKDGNTWSLIANSFDTMWGTSPSWWWGQFALNGNTIQGYYVIAIRYLSSTGHVWIEEAKQGGWWDLTTANETGNLTNFNRPGLGGDPGH